MSMLIKRGKHAYYLTGITKIALVGFLATIANAALLTVWSVYLNSFLGSEVYVGLLSAALTVVGFLSYFVFIPLIEKADKAKVFMYALFVSIITFLLFSIIDSLALLILLATVMTVVTALRITSYGIIVKDNSKKKVLSKNMGIVFTFLNTAYLVGPLMAGYIAAQINTSSVFIAAALFLFVALLVFQATGIRDAKGKKDVDKNLFKNFIDFFKNKNRVVAYMLHGGINMWWMMIYIYMPLYILRQGLSELWIGYFLFAVAVPLISLEFLLARWANKKGFKTSFKLGYFFVGAIALICFFVANIYAILALLVLASFGMAMLEPTTVAYFFDILKGKERYRFYGPFNTAGDTGGFIGKLAPSLVLIFLPFKFIFILYAALMFALFIVAFKAQDIVESR